MRNIIVGTAGHIDHGKTALVRALTGINTDRLEEEKRRGISIDLGFAHLTIGSTHFGFVDVPGHERFVRNMLAGAGGIDVVLLVIGADESVKPQTREHFEICRLLGVSRGIVVLTKADLVEPDWLELVRMEVDEFVAGSFLEGAPVVAVSSKTGQGLDGLKDRLVELSAQVPARDPAGLLRLPIDRSFTMRGFGTVITGTLASGAIHVEQEIEVQPGGTRLRVRGVQVHGKAVEKATAGQRTAVNLAGIEATQLKRGMVLTPTAILRPTQIVDTRFHLLPSAMPLKHRAPVHFHAGTAEVEAEVRTLEGTKPVAPGATSWVRFLLSDPVLLEPGDRFIVRMFSPVVTIGGGEVVENTPPVRLKRALAIARLQALVEAPVQTLVGERPHGIGIKELVARSGRPESRILAEAKTLGLMRYGDTLIAKVAFESAARDLRDAIAVFHKQNPLSPGLLRAQSPVPPALMDSVLTACPDIVAEGETLRLASHKLALRQDEDQAVAKIESLFRDAGLAVPSTNEVLAQSGVELARAKSLLQILFRQAKLVRISQDLVFHANAIAELRKILAGRKGQRFGVADFKDWTNVSRKYAIPLLEFLDRERVTRRDGDQRAIL